MFKSDLVLNLLKKTLLLSLWPNLAASLQWKTYIRCYDTTAHTNNIICFVLTDYTNKSTITWMEGNMVRYCILV